MLRYLLAALLIIQFGCDPIEDDDSNPEAAAVVKPRPLATALRGQFGQQAEKQVQVLMLAMPLWRRSGSGDAGSGANAGNAGSGGAAGSGGDAGSGASVMRPGGSRLRRQCRRWWRRRRSRYVPIL